MFAVAIISICTMILILMMALLSILIIYKKRTRKPKNLNDGN